MTRRTPRPWTPEEDAHLLQWSQQGVSLAEMSRRFDRHNGSIYDRKQRLRRQQAVAGAVMRDKNWTNIEQARAARTEALLSERPIGDEICGVPLPGRSAWDRLSPEQRKTMS